jgi:hypothetical protein
MAWDVFAVDALESRRLCSSVALLVDVPTWTCAMLIFFFFLFLFLFLLFLEEES